NDEVGIMLHASRSDMVRGAINAVSPHPVTNLDFTAALARAVHRPAIFPVPRVALRIAFGEFCDILIASQRAIPRVAEESGYKFEYSDIDGALNDVIGSTARTSAA